MNTTVRLVCADCGELALVSIMREGDAVKVPRCNACGCPRLMLPSAAEAGGDAE